MITRSEAVHIVESWQWTCSDCGTTGMSKTRHAARRRLNTHWRTCTPQPGGANTPAPEPRPSGSSG